MVGVHFSFSLGPYRRMVSFARAYPDRPSLAVSAAPGYALGVLTLALLGALLIWDASGLDLPLARLFGDAHGFAWRDQPLFVLVLHAWPRWIGAAALLALIVGVRYPWGWLRAVPRAGRWQIVGSTLLALVAVGAVKRVSATSCPWDLAEFGGVAHYVSHWAWGVFDGGAGHCFPAGHASTAFAFLAGWFVLRRHAPRVAARWLVAVLALGLVLGVAQQMRGAHYMSHTLWTAWICWAVGWGVDELVQLCQRARGVLKMPR